ncbi:MAG: hypothetical protein O3C57_00700 [Verrucomicrobia bacterium]|nr:hypothetical protein [Verrucomicrobiota bacterium]
MHTPDKCSRAARVRPMARTYVRLSAVVLATVNAHAAIVTINLGGLSGGRTVDLEVDLTHVGPTGDLVAPNVPTATPFLPPAVFSAPLPTGSGARALGFAGAFTAVADDATAASWNPGGLIQLERPETSIVYRYANEKQRHRSDDSSFAVGENAFEGQHFNYVSVVLPFYSIPLERNFVFSLNVQEAYDFEQRFTARINQRSTRQDGAETLGVFEEKQVDHYSVGTLATDFFHLDATVTTDLKTDVSSRFRQSLQSSLLSELEFEQEGVISAFSPALAAEITPRLSAGAALNAYRLDPSSGEEIRSRTVARYKGRSESAVRSTSERNTESSYTLTGRLEQESGVIGTRVSTISMTGVFEPFTDISTAQRNDVLIVDGTFEEINVLNDLEGYNGTFGFLWMPTRRASVGAAIDLPWTATATQKKITRNHVISTDARTGRVVDDTNIVDTSVKDVEFRFPLYWAVGFLWRWTQMFYSTIDISQTQWSDFAFQAEGEAKINPLDGTPHSQNKLDDTWAFKTGMEYLFVTQRTEIPMRAGFAYEERPALDQPDVFYSVSAGTGVSIGQEPNRVFVDLAYIYTWAKNVRGIVPGQNSLASDVAEHQGYLSVIKHF